MAASFGSALVPIATPLNQINDKKSNKSRQTRLIMKIPTIRIEQHYDNREVKCFAERPANLDAMFRATVARVPDALALIADAERFSYRELDQRIDIVVTQLQNAASAMATASHC